MRTGYSIENERVKRLKSNSPRKKRCLKELSMAPKPTYKELAKRVTALEESRLLLETLMDTIEGEAFIKDSKGKYLYVNKSFCQDFGIDPKATIGNDDYKIFSSDVAKKLRENDRLIMAGKKPVTIEERGVVKGKKMTYMTNKALLIDSDGNVKGICGVGFNITYQKKIEQELKNSHTDLEKKVRERTAELLTMVDKLKKAELQYRTVADFTYNWEFWVNLDGSLQYVSPSCERISGYTSQQFQENPSLFREIILPGDLGGWVEHVQDSRMNPGVKEIQFQIRHHDGTLRWIEHVCQPVTDDMKTLLGFRASNRDITKRKEGEIQLQKAYSKIKNLQAQLEADQTYLRDEIKQQHDYENIIGNSDVMQYVFLRVQQIAPTNTTVLIQGETGTGKELIARAIHNASLRKNHSLIKVDCASLPSNLIESELFGHEKGAFTNAVGKRLGRFELANGSTIFLDEIGELPMDLQSRLLRVLQDGEFERVGSSRTRHTDVRVIAATNRDLEDEVNKKKFRMDLWFRLNVFPITIPPLRERGEDIFLIANHIINMTAKKFGKQINTIPKDVVSQLKDYSWPGNVRELENVIERSLIKTQGDALQLDGTLQGQGSVDKDSCAMPIKSLREIEREHILLALRKTNWQIHGKEGVAAMLDINPSTLRGRMRKLKIHRPSYKN